MAWVRDIDSFYNFIGYVVLSDLAPVFPDPSYSQRNAASLTGERRAWAA